MIWTSGWVLSAGLLQERFSDLIQWPPHRVKVYDLEALSKVALLPDAPLHTMPPASLTFDSLHVGLGRGAWDFAGF